MCKLNEDYLFQLIPKDYIYLTTTKTIIFQGMELKTDYLINIIHEFSLKYTLTNELCSNICSTILRKKYGKFYNYYISYLLEKKFIFLISNYYAGKKSRTYKINDTNIIFTKCKIYDKFLLKKHKKDFLVENFTQSKDSPIKEEIRKKLVDDLYHVQIDYNKSCDWLNNEKECDRIDLQKYFMNLMSIESIHGSYLYYQFDSYGRLHTNFTNLKKYIRNNYLTIDNKQLSEYDIKNSQPFFLGIFIKKTMGQNITDNMKYYFDVVKNGLIYDMILDKHPELYKTRDEVKVMIYKVIFGKNIDNKIESKIFKGIFPDIYKFMKEYKKDNYKELSHKLQRLESDFIFGNIISKIHEKFPNIRLFTVHDSIIFPTEYKEEVGLIFRNYLKDIL
ncbi:hypothetical protein M0Q50_03060 [bacterium]|jgi:hypothetical protein|nr:hypothetical protein [bacterium]